MARRQKPRQNMINDTRDPQLEYNDHDVSSNFKGNNRGGNKSKWNEPPHPHQFHHQRGETMASGRSTRLAAVIMDICESEGNREGKSTLQ